MIQEIKIKNFLSFKDEMTFSFEATKDQFAEEYQVVEVVSGVRLLRFAMIYGANASGKSNLLTIIDFLRQFWLYPKKMIENPTGAIPFAFDSVAVKEPSRIEMVFFVGTSKYAYQLELDPQVVYFEKLSYYTSIQPTMLFERTLENGKSVIKYNSAVNKINTAEKERIAAQCLRNMSVFAAIGQANASLPEINTAREWMLRQYMPLVSPTMSLTNFAENNLRNDKALKSHIVNFFQNVSLSNISNVDTQTVGIETNADIYNPRTGHRELKSDVEIPLQTVFEHVVNNERGTEKYWLPLHFESYGTQRVFGLASAIYYAHKYNAFFPIDEIEASLHPKLLEKLIYQYLLEKSQSQILVTIHDDSLMDAIDNLIRKDSIWFTDKKESGSTDLYRLTDFNGLNRLSSIRTAYRLGRFGATVK